MIKLSIADAQKKVDDWINQFEEGYWTPLSMFAALVEEVGELAEEINSLEGYKPKKSDDGYVDVEMELGDVLFALICIANYYDVDLDDAVQKVMAKYENRDRTRWTLRSGQP